MKHAFATLSWRLALPALAALAAAMPAHAQKGPNYPITSQQRATAQKVAQDGVPLSELAPNAPDEYTVRRGDTLWRISGLFLRSPWRWPELWGMNIDDIRNPHLIYPGQKLFLDKTGGRARLRLMRPVSGASGGTVRVSPQTRVEMLDTSPLPTLQPHLIEPFLAEPIVADLETFEKAPRIVARTDQRVLMAKGDRAYARGPAGAPLVIKPGEPTIYRVFRKAVPLKDPVTGEVLGYEGEYVGRVDLVRSESVGQSSDGDQAGTSYTMPASGESSAPQTHTSGRQGDSSEVPVAATVDIVSTKEEIRAGDRMLIEPDREFRSYTPHAPLFPVQARVVSVYGPSVRIVGQRQVVAINQGAQDGIEPGQVLALLSTGKKVKDKTQEGWNQTVQLPDERNGLAMVFRVFDRVSYVLVMEITQPVEIGDKLVNPN